MSLFYQTAKFNNDGKRYDISQIDEFFDIVKKSGCNDRSPFTYRRMSYNNGYYVFNVPCAFDTETTSVELEENHHITKTAVMYIWMFGINGYTIYGRKWDDWFKVLERCQNEFNLNESRRMIIYIHNLPFDFSFFKNQIKISDMFLMESRKALNIVEDAFEFRCSYLLAGTGLETVGKNLIKYKVQKLKGNLDYDLKRHFNTPLSEKELDYCINDVRVQMSFIQECMDQEGGNLATVPSTFTGYVRRDIEKAMKADKRAYKFVKNLKLTKEEYQLWHRAFQGGFTHTNIRHKSETCEDVVSYDYTSSYPSQMIAQEYPISNGVKVDWSDWDTNFDENYKKFMELCTYYILCFDIKIWNLKLKDKAPDTPLSKSKCWVLKPHYEEVNGQKVDFSKDNGKVVWADYVETTMTSVGFINVLAKYYDLSEATFEITNCYKYMKGYLPKPYIEKILEYYGKKTTLKGVVGREIDYQQGKARINALYGMMVQAILHEMFIEWGARAIEQSEEDLAEQIGKYNESRKRVSWYPWGVMITEYARAALLEGIWEVGYRDYIYADTDSMKIMNERKHLDYILKYNTDIQEKHRKCLEYYDMDINLLRPKTIKGKEKPLGVWDFDGHYSRFKALHSKCYISEIDDDPRNDPDDIGLHCTIAGLAKDKGIEYLKKEEKKGNDPFDTFQIGMCVEAEDSGKLCHYYNDEIITFELTDYLGNTETVTTYGGVNLSHIPFEIGKTDMWMLMLEALAEGKEAR